MKLTFYGAARSVTGSMHLLTVDDKKILFDCGLFQGRRKEAYARNKKFPFDPTEIDALILSHAHIDHSGNIPNFVKSGFGGDIFCTHATRDLCSIMLRDSGHIHQKDAEFVNKKHAKKGLPPVDPLYTVEDAMAAMDNFVSFGYRRPFQVSNNVTVKFYDAGHILGSAITVFHIMRNGEHLKVAFTGDLGRKHLPIIRDPQAIEDVDVLITESTYGGRIHDDPTTVSEKLAKVVNDTFSRGGKIIIPAFSVGRTQEIVYELHGLFNAKKIPEIPIFVDSPLSVNATEVFRTHPECFDEETNEFLINDQDPFGFSRLHYVKSLQESKNLNSYTNPCVIISASGMCEAGRILHHLRNNIENPQNTILIVGYMAENTLGRRLVEREPVVKIFGEDYNLHAQVIKLNAFSAHADHNELLEYIGQLNRLQLKHVYVVHGELAQSDALAQGIGSLGISGVHVPELGETITVD